MAHDQIEGPMNLIYKVSRKEGNPKYLVRKSINACVMSRSYFNINRNMHIHLIKYFYQGQSHFLLFLVKPEKFSESNFCGYT